MKPYSSTHTVFTNKSTFILFIITYHGSVHVQSYIYTAQLSFTVILIYKKRISTY